MFSTSRVPGLHGQCYIRWVCGHCSRGGENITSDGIKRGIEEELWFSGGCLFALAFFLLAVWGVLTSGTGHRHRGGGQRGKKYTTVQYSTVCVMVGVSSSC